jgi:hypothetical protein
MEAAKKSRDMEVTKELRDMEVAKELRDMDSGYKTHRMIQACNQQDTGVTQTKQPFVLERGRHHRPWRSLRNSPGYVWFATTINHMSM